MHPTSNDLGKAFETYCSLQSESYEFVTRSIAMHKWLEEAFRVLQEKPDLTAEELYQAWQPAFDRVYSHLFTPLLRAHRLMTFPFGEFPLSQERSCAVDGR